MIKRKAKLKTSKPKTKTAYPDINGMFIYHDSLHRIVYAPLFSTRGYLIPKSQIDEFYRYTQRTMISVFIGLAATVLLGMNAFDGFFLGFLVYLVWTGYFSVKFLNQLATVEPFVRPKKENYFITLSRKYSVPTFVGLIGLSLIFVLLIGIYTWTSSLSSTEFYTNLILMGGVGLFAAVHGIGLFLQLRMARV